MKVEIWLARCAAELQHLYLTNPNRGVNAVPLDDWNMDTAGELIEAQRYRGLDPVQAARSFWRDSTSRPQLGDGDGRVGLVDAAGGARAIRGPGMSPT